MEVLIKSKRGRRAIREEQKLKRRKKRFKFENNFTHCYCLLKLE
jgi:hypothetical protein